MPVLLKKLSGGAVIPVQTDTLIHIAQRNHKDQLYLEVANVSSAPAFIDLLMGGEYVCKGVEVDPNSAPHILVKNLVAFAPIFATCTPPGGVVITGHVKCRQK